MKRNLLPAGSDTPFVQSSNVRVRIVFAVAVSEWTQAEVLKQFFGKEFDHVLVVSDVIRLSAQNTTSFQEQLFVVPVWIDGVQSNRMLIVTTQQQRLQRGNARMLSGPSSVARLEALELWELSRNVAGLQCDRIEPSAGTRHDWSVVSVRKHGHHSWKGERREDHG
jgi:hypothetical protein